MILFGRRSELEKFDEGNDQTALGDQCAEEPFHKVGFHCLDGCFGFVPQGFLYRGWRRGKRLRQNCSPLLLWIAILLTVSQST